MEALVTDGAHHKQYYLEEILTLIHGKEQFEKLRNEVQWESGIPA